MSFVPAVALAQTPTQSWALHVGTTGTDTGYGVAADGAGNLFLAGATSGNLAATSAGIDDAFLMKYNAAGSLAWSRQTGTAGTDHAWAVAADVAGNSYITGFTTSNLAGHVGRRE